MRTILGLSSLLTLALIAALSAPPARACGTAPPLPGEPAPVVQPDDTELHWGLAIAAGAAVDATLIGAQLAMTQDLFPAWLAAIELVVAVGQTALGFVLGVHGIAQSSCGPGTYPPLASVALLAAGGWLFAHAIWSLLDGDEPETTVLPTAAIGPDGALLGVVGTF